ncbi:MAG: hypothetical protein AB9919_12350 [Geobacteraceae bacterium]
MLRRVVEDYLESIKEVQFFLPFSYLLSLKGYYDVHIIHGSSEFGKDIIAKKIEDGVPVQFLFQLKAGDINLSKYRDEIQSQLLEAAVNNLSHPNFDPLLNKKILFVTTGTIKPPATLAFQEFNNFLQSKYKLDPILSIEKLNLIEDFVFHGLEPFFALHSDPAFVGEFFDLYAKIKNNKPLDSFSIEAYTRRWIKTDCESDINRLQVFLEAYLFSTLLYKSKQYYLAVLFLAGLARFLSKSSLYEQHNQVLIEYVNNIVENLVEDVQAVYKCGQSLVNPASATGLLAIFKYPKICLHTLELLSLANLLSDDHDLELKELISEVIHRERGWERPLSDNYAMSVALIGLSLLKDADYVPLRKLVNNITIWLCDRYVNIGIAQLGAAEDEECEQLLSEYLDGLNHQKSKSSFTAGILLDLAFLADDPQFYESIANELRASSIIIERFHVLNDTDIYEYDRINNTYDSEYSKKYIDVYSSGIALEKERNKVTSRSPVLFYLMFLLRDRFFPTFIRDLI